MLTINIYIGKLYKDIYVYSIIMPRGQTSPGQTHASGEQYNTRKGLPSKLEARPFRILLFRGRNK